MEEMTVMNNGAKDDMSAKIDIENMEPWEVCQLQILDFLSSHKSSHCSSVS